MDPTFERLSRPGPPEAARVALVSARIDELLRRHLEGPSVEEVRDAVVHGRVVHVDGADTSSVVAFKRGVLFIAGVEYVVSDE